MARTAFQVKLKLTLTLNMMQRSMSGEAHLCTDHVIGHGRVFDRPRYKAPKPKSLRISGQYKLAVRSAEEGTRQHTSSIRNELPSECKNRALIAQLATDQNYDFEYHN
jgi:hypothetical protein